MIRTFFYTQLHYVNVVYTQLIIVVLQYGSVVYCELKYMEQEFSAIFSLVALWKRRYHSQPHLLYRQT